MNRIIIIAAALAALVRPAMADSGDESHYRTAFGHRLVCTSNRWANFDPCSRVTLAEVKRIDVLAEDACQQGEDIIPHALSATPARSTIDAPTGT